MLSDITLPSSSVLLQAGLGESAGWVTQPCGYPFAFHHSNFSRHCIVCMPAQVLIIWKMWILCVVRGSAVGRQAGVTN